MARNAPYSTRPLCLLSLYLIYSLVMGAWYCAMQYHE